MYHTPVKWLAEPWGSVQGHPGIKLKMLQLLVAEAGLVGLGHLVCEDEDLLGCVGPILV